MPTVENQTIMYKQLCEANKATCYSAKLAYENPKQYWDIDNNQQIPTDLTLSSISISTKLSTQ